MKILLATDVFPPKSGGSGWSAFYLARALAQRGHVVRVVMPRAGSQAVQTRAYAEIEVVEIGYRVSNMPGLRAWQRTRALEKTFSAYLAECAREFDVIHAQHTLSIGAAIATKRIARIPVVSTVRDYWPVCLYGTRWRDDTICPICRGGEITRCLRQKYGSAANFMQPALPFVERELRRRQQTLRDSDAVIAVSEYVAQSLRGIARAAQLHVIPNLIDAAETRRLATRDAADALRAAPYLLFIGKLNALKGADWLPQILAQSGVAAPLVVAGDGELKTALARHQQIELRGWLSNAETLTLLARAKALLFPARWAEPLARTLLEAQALGIPTIACDTGGTRDIIEDNVNGLLANSIAEFAAALRRLMNDDALRARLGENAKRAAQAKFSPRVVTEKLEAVYARAIQHAALNLSDS